MLRRRRCSVREEGAKAQSAKHDAADVTDGGEGGGRSPRKTRQLRSWKTVSARVIIARGVNWRMRASASACVRTQARSGRLARTMSNPPSPSVRPSVGDRATYGHRSARSHEEGERGGGADECDGEERGGKVFLSILGASGTLRFGHHANMMALSGFTARTAPDPNTLLEDAGRRRITRKTAVPRGRRQNWGTLGRTTEWSLPSQPTLGRRRT